MAGWLLCEQQSLDRCSLFPDGAGERWDGIPPIPQGGFACRRLAVCFGASKGMPIIMRKPVRMLMYGKEASNRKQEIDRQHHTIPNQRNKRPKDKHRGNVYNLLLRHGKVRSQNMEKLKGSFPTFCKQTFPQLHKTASYAHYAQCRLLRNPFHIYH